MAFFTDEQVEVLAAVAKGYQDYKNGDPLSDEAVNNHEALYDLVRVLKPFGPEFRLMWVEFIQTSHNFRNFSDARKRR